MAITMLQTLLLLAALVLLHTVPCSHCSTVETSSISSSSATEVAGAAGGPSPAVHNVILDVDAAGLLDFSLDLDDDLALLLALGSDTSTKPVGCTPAPDSWQQDGVCIRLLGVTLTYGNSALHLVEETVRTWLNITGLAASGLPVHAGSGWLGAPSGTPVHTQQGRSHAGKQLFATPAATFIRDTVLQQPANSVTIVALGPLTNIATAFDLDERVEARLRRLVVMGGDMRVNRWFDIDLNFVITDAPAARRVLEAHSGLDRVVVPIQTCIQAALTRVEVEQLAAACPGAAACALLHRLQASVAASPPPINELFRGDGYTPRSVRALPKGNPSGFFPWDTVAFMSLLRPDLFAQVEPYTVRVHRWQSQFDPVPSHEGSAAASAAAAACNAEAGLGSSGCHSGAFGDNVVLVPRRVVDEAAVLREAVARMVRPRHQFPTANVDDFVVHGHRRIVRMLLAAVATVLVLLLACIGAVCWWCVCRRRASQQSKEKAS